MRFLYRLQQRLALTAVEGTVLCALAASLALGTAVRGFQNRDAAPAAELFAADARFAALDRAAAERAAGGAVAGGDAPVVSADSTNLAAAPPAGAPGPAAPSHPGHTAEADPAPGSINLNTAGAADLERLPRIGPALAARIVDDRDRLGPFRRIEDVERVRGIGPAIRARIAPFVRL